MRKLLAGAVLVGLVACSPDSGDMLTAPQGIQTSVVGENEFQVRSEGYFRFDFSREWVDDIEPRNDGVLGSGRWIDGDRPGGYHSAFVVFEHQDPGGHGAIPAIRLSFTRIGSVPAATARLTDYDMDESIPDRTWPYSYEKDPRLDQSCDQSVPADTVGIFHARQAPAGGDYRYRQLLREFVFSESAPENEVEWYYQGRGRFCGVADGGPMFEATFAGFHDGEWAEPKNLYVTCTAGVQTLRCNPNRRKADGSPGGDY